MGERRRERQLDFQWAKALTASGAGSVDVLSDEAGVDYNPLGVTFNPANGGSMSVFGDFTGNLALDCITLNTPSDTARNSFVAQLEANPNNVSCRIWNGLDPDDNNWNSPQNWNNGRVPANGESVYVPYTGNDFDNPTMNAPNVELDRLSIADNRTLTMTEDLLILGGLDLLGGYVVVLNNKVLTLDNTATIFSREEGFVVGKLQKTLGEFSGSIPFTFHVGTAGQNGEPFYSPVNVTFLPNNALFSQLTVKAVDGVHPNTPSPTHRVSRYWSLDGTNVKANLTFKWLQIDEEGNPALYRLYKINSPSAIEQPAVINTTNRTATVNNVMSFSDWVISASPATAASVQISGRVTTVSGRGIARARVLMTNTNGNTRTALTNSFGYYRFENVAVGQTYIFNVTSKGNSFAPRVVIISEQIENLDFTAQ